MATFRTKIGRGSGLG